jgi:endoglucanase
MPKKLKISKQYSILAVSLLVIASSGAVYGRVFHSQFAAYAAPGTNASLHKSKQVASKAKTLGAAAATTNSQSVSNTPKPSAPPSTTSIATASTTKTLTAVKAKAIYTTPAPVIVTTATLYANPSSNVATNAQAWAVNNPSDAATMNRLAATPMAQWFGDTMTPNVEAAADSYVSAAAANGQVPELVAYNIPERDCGSYSSGGATSAAAYESWINSFASGIGERSAIVIVEPDALAGMDCLSAADQTTRLELINDAVHTLRADTKAAIYLDAGSSDWQSTATMASRLASADIADATGFSLNVSNFETTTSSVSYGTSLSKAIGGKHFIVDTSRNGNGPASGDLAWCNPDGRAFGATPTLRTNTNLVDGYLWIKAPGESDGTCNVDQAGTSPPAAGTWWPQYALMLISNSSW